MNRAMVVAAMLAVLWAPAAAEAAEEPPPPGAAQATRGSELARLWLDLFGGGVLGQDNALENGGAFGVRGAVFFHRQLGVEAGVRRHHLDVSGTRDNALSGGSLDATLWTANLVVRFAPRPGVVPYLSGGFAYADNDFDIDEGVVADLRAFNFEVTEEMDASAGFNLGGGIAVGLGSRVAVFGEVRYVGASADTLARIRDRAGGIAAEESGSQDLDALALSAGVRVLF